MRSSIYVFFLSLMMSAALAFAQEDADEALPSGDETALEQDESSDDASSGEESMASDEESASDEAASEGEVAKAPSGDFKGKISRKGKDWYLGDNKVDEDVIVEELNANSRSASEFRTSRVFYYPGLVLGAAGGFAVGYGAVSWIMGEDYGMPVTLAGVGVVGVAVLLNYIAGRYVDSSIQIYNLEVGYDMALKLQVVPTQQGGLALALAF